jgi:MFS family permease
VAQGPIRRRVSRPSSVAAGNVPAVTRAAALERDWLTENLPAGIKLAPLKPNCTTNGKHNRNKVNALALLPPPCSPPPAGRQAKPTQLSGPRPRAFSQVRQASSQRLAGLRFHRSLASGELGYVSVQKLLECDAMPTQAPPITGMTPRLLPVIAWATASFFFFYAWIMRVAPSVMVEELMREFAVGAGVLGHLSAAYFYGYAGMQIPVGLLLDRFGPLRLNTLAALCCAGGCVLFAVGTTLATVAVGRFLIGAGAAFSLVGSMVVAGQWFSPSRFAVLSGLAMAMGMAGGVFGQAPLRLAVEATDWRTTSLTLAVGGVAIALSAWLSVRDRWRGAGGLRTLFANFGLVLKHRQTWLVAFAGLGTSGPLLGFAGLWGVPFLQAAYGLERTAAAALTSLLFVGWGVGAPLFGWLSDQIGRRRPVLMAGLLLESAALVALVYIADLPPLVVAALCFLTGFFGSAQIVCFAIAKENHPPRLAATGIGFVNAMVTGAGALFQPLMGFLLDFAWKGEISAGARVYDLTAFHFAFSSLLVCGLAGLLCLLAVRETYCQPVA